MKPLSSGDTGVITPDTALATADAATLSVLGAVPADLTPQAILDVPLMQLPEDEETVEEPVLTLAQKITEDTPAAGAFPGGGMPGMSGLGDGAVLPQDILSGISADASAALSGFEGTVTQAAAPALAAAQTAFDQAKSALAGTSGGGAANPAGTGGSAATTTMSEDPVSALMSGLSLPALPGIESLFQPLLELLSSFGSGVFGSFDPTALLSSSSAAIETAMSVAQGGVKTVQQVWEGQSADAATVASQQAQNQGEETSQRGIDIAALTQQAATVVQTGNAQLTGIATTFAAQAVALAPTIMLPPTQATLIGLATQHLGQAVTVVNTTRGQLAGHTAELGGVVHQLAAQSGLPSPDQVLTAASENIGEPLLTKAQDALTGSDGATTAAGTGGATNPGATTPSSLGTGGAGVSGSGGSGGSGASLGALGTPRAGSGGSTGGGAGTPSTGSPKATALPGAGLPAGRAMTTPAMTSGFGGTPAAGANGSNFMGGGGAGAGAGQRGNNDEEHGRTVQPYQSRTGNDDLTGPLGESTPDVIGAVHEDERDTAEDRF
ncbi:hypothetical protein [Nocardia mangyaensis]|uniref:hypothetical protein n=1 Tax=Nocardia mangyaensis TaxID=2213200 RepID=UPI002676D43D|nr:hypothetical protein [Nocardia mangyaensis]MDO3646690.1 hypothetical protein [Nocardia mangyaensis]